MPPHHDTRLQRLQREKEMLVRAVKHSSALRAALVVELKHSEADADMHKHNNMRHALVRCEMSDLVQLLKKSLEDPSLGTFSSDGRPNCVTRVRGTFLSDGRPNCVTRVRGTFFSDGRPNRVTD